MFAIKRKSKKTEKNLKKVLTEGEGLWYYIRALKRRGPRGPLSGVRKGTERGMEGRRRERGNLENDTERLRKNDS